MNRAQGDSTAELDLWHTLWIPEAHDYERSMHPEQLAEVVLNGNSPKGGPGTST